MVLGSAKSRAATRRLQMILQSGAVVNIENQCAEDAATYDARVGMSDNPNKVGAVVVHKSLTKPRRTQLVSSRHLTEIIDFTSVIVRGGDTDGIRMNNLDRRIARILLKNAGRMPALPGAPGSFAITSEGNLKIHTNLAFSNSFLCSRNMSTRSGSN